MLPAVRETVTMVMRSQAMIADIAYAMAIFVVDLSNMDDCLSIQVKTN